MQFGSSDDPQAVEEAQVVVPDDGFDHCLVEVLQKIRLHVERLDLL